MRGGKREGAGRKPNSPNKASIERQTKVAESGITPLDVMIENMRFAYTEAAALLSKILKSGSPEEGFDAFKELLRFRQMAQECAKDAAPYIHPRLSSVQVGGDPDNPIVVTDARDRLSHLLTRATDADQATGNTKTTH